MARTGVFILNLFILWFLYFLCKGIGWFKYKDVIIIHIKLHLPWDSNSHVSWGVYNKYVVFNILQSLSSPPPGYKSISLY